MVLTLFETMFGTPPIIFSLQSELLEDLEDQTYLIPSNDYNGLTSIYGLNSGLYMKLLPPSNHTDSARRLGLPMVPSSSFQWKRPLIILMTIPTAINWMDWTIGSVICRHGLHLPTKRTTEEMTGSFTAHHQHAVGSVQA